MASVALASLTEMYTDSEGEEASLRADLLDKTYPKKDNIEFHRQKTPPPIKLRTNLVSYLDDTIASDDEATDKLSESPTRLKNTAPYFTDVDMPPEPSGTCSNELQQKICALTEKMKGKKSDMNQIIQERKSFRNPSIYEKLIHFCNINEFGTNYDPGVYDPLKWNKTSYYDELAKLQKKEMDRREKEKRERTKVEVLMGTAKKSLNGANTSVVTDEDVKKRKSKWDQVGVYTSQGMIRPPSGVVPMTSAYMTSTATGTKGTIISAFGFLSKQPKV